MVKNLAGIMQNLAGMGNMTEQVIATDLLLSSKQAIKHYASALAETASVEVRDTLRRQMDAAISAHEKVTNYMTSKGYYHAYNPQEQIRVDLQATNTVLNLQS